MSKSENLVLRLERTTLRRLETLSRRLGASKSELVRRSIEDLLWRGRFAAARDKTIPKARAAGWYNEEDVFRSVS